MTTVVLILLCLAIAGRELYLAFDRKRTPEEQITAAELAALQARLSELESELQAASATGPPPAPALQAAKPDDAAESASRAALQNRLDDIEPRLTRQEEGLRVADTRIRSLIEQINDRVLPEINERLAEQRDTTDRLAAEVARLRRQMRRRLEEAARASLGGDPVDVVRGLLGGKVPASARVALTEAYERCAAAHGLQVELADSSGDKTPWHTRYYLSGTSPRELERDFLKAMGALRGGAGPDRLGELQPLLSELCRLEEGLVQIGPLLIVRASGTLLCGVRPLVESLHRDPSSAAVKDLQTLAGRLLELPATRRCDLSSWRPETLSA
ncbi:hypothetical protein [Thermomonospora curvata]|uniref:Uncharacterized protein n=1 Tax=Thermomonospora curvata (strain ATCC 19995 / DSM 43183 / JCM 3096 / KCTC 9072 / NBRC 15933 / NCIMB 10081 / Henssen B9) TaxID=471852 RepID=D1A747_THECD|nr:hypothetical protein [Thermomonospora curvata]ACZ00253.1 hypothetical protein Tcur_4731 [Thermomonospora curvata DSM 43183]